MNGSIAQQLQRVREKVFGKMLGLEISGIAGNDLASIRLPVKWSHSISDLCMTMCASTAYFTIQYTILECMYYYNQYI